MTEFEQQMRQRFPDTVNSLAQQIGYRQIELQQETNRLLSEILRRLPAFTIVPAPAFKDAERSPERE